MRQRRFAALVLGLLGVLCGSWRGDAQERTSLIREPLLDFVQNSPAPNPTDDLLVIQLDLSGDGKREWLLSWSSEVDGKAGNIWTGYFPANGFYGRTEEAATFRRDAYFLGNYAGVDGTVLLSYFPANSRNGQLTGLQFDGLNFHSLALGQIEPLGAQAELYRRLFIDSTRPHMETLSPEALKKEIARLTSFSERGGPIQPGQTGPLGPQSPPSSSGKEGAEIAALSTVSKPGGGSFFFILALFVGAICLNLWLRIPQRVRQRNGSRRPPGVG